MTHKKTDFTHLHLHTSFSLLDGACRINDLMDAVDDAGMSSVAITDHGVMYGAVDFYKAARAKGIKPIIGCEAYIASGNRTDRTRTPDRPLHHHLVLLATGDEGYHNLARLASRAQMEGFYYKPRIDREILAEHSKGLIGLSACMKGDVAWRLNKDDHEGAVKAAGEFADIFGKDNFFLEVMDHNIPEQRKINTGMKKVSQQTGLPIVATNDVHYLEKSHAAAHEVMLCLQTGTVMSDPKRMRYSSEEFYLKTREELEPLFREFPGSMDLTLEIADRCNLEMEFGTLHFPTFDCPDGMDQKQYLIHLAHEGVKKHYHLSDPMNPRDDRERQVMARFEEELAVIEKTGFINYFLVVWDFVHFAHSHSIPVGPGRGSGGGSLVAYALGITQIDPLRYELIFERFLNPERVSPPDFDIDFCQARREEVINYVKQKYGRDSVAKIITFGSLGAKTVIRDVGRALEIPFSECDRLSKMIPEEPKMTIKKAMELNPEFKKAYETEDSCKRILDYGVVLEGLYRNPGTHAAGVVIGEKILTEIIPLALDKEKEPVTQYTMEPLGEIGLLKMDFLGLKTLTVIHEAVALIKESRDIDIDLDTLPLDDGPTYELLNRGDTVGVFQLESGGMRDMFRKIHIVGIEDIIALIALYRPGPMNMLPDYIARKSGEAEIHYDHPLLEPILKETYGVMVYQEQVQRAANILAGYSLGEADILRRAMGKKKISVMEEQRAKFVKGSADTNNIKAAKAGQIFDTMAQFAGYGFNKAHSAGYGIISYQTAYLKANYPEEFMSALLSSEIGNFDKIPIFVSEVSDMGLKILPPDVNASRARFAPEAGGVRYGLAGTKNVGAGAADAIVGERKNNGPYTGLIELCERLDGQLINKKVLESLIRSGALDGLEMHRARMFNAIDFSLSRASNRQKDLASGQGNLFDMLEPAGENTQDDLPASEEWPESTMLGAEKELLGVYMSGHPLTRYASLLERYQLSTVQSMQELDEGTPTRLGGMITNVHKLFTKASKEMMAAVQIEDLDGSVEIMLFPEAYAKHAVHLEEEMPVLVCGEVSHRKEPAQLIASEVYRLGDAPKFFAEKARIHIPVAHADTERIERVKDIVRLHPGTTPLTVCLLFPTGEKIFIEAGTGFTVCPDEALVHEVEHELGEGSMYVTVSRKACRFNHERRRFGGKGNGNG